MVWTGSETKQDPARSWRNPGYAQTGRNPVVCVSWTDAQAYVTWLSEKTGQPYRLLNEAEWEYAARAGTTAPRYWGHSADDSCSYANGADLTAKSHYPGWTVANCRDGHVWTAPVGSFSANAFGLFDPIGNVWELVGDCWNDSYADAPTTGEAWTAGDCSDRVLRGGSWNNKPRNLRSANRNRNRAGNRNNNSGFRVASTLRRRSRRVHGPAWRA